MRTTSLAVTFALFAFLATQALAQAEKGQSVAAAISELQKRVDFLEGRANSIRNRVPYQFSLLDCNTSKFDEFSLTTNTLAFFAACTKIEPYLEGHRITISIGNPHSFHFREVKGILNYGKDMVDAVNKTVEISPLEGLRAGVWTTVVITVNPSRPDEMRYLRMELGSSTVSPGR